MGNVLDKMRLVWRDERGGEIMEYAVLLGLISIAAITVIAAYGTKVLARWGSVNSSV